MAQINEGMAHHGNAYFAYEQRAGKGQRNKSWISEKKSNILLSVVIDPFPLKSTQLFELSACMAVAVHYFFIHYAGKKCKIKWPNDLYWNDRKAGGILIQNIISGDGLTGNWQWTVVGVGININQTSFPVELINPVSLKQITGKNYKPVELAKKLCLIMDQFFNKLIQEGFSNILSIYNEILYKNHETVKLKKDNRVFEATIKGVSAAGSLIVQHAIEEEFEYGQVEILHQSK